MVIVPASKNNKISRRPVYNFLCIHPIKVALFLYLLPPFVAFKIISVYIAQYQFIVRVAFILHAETRAS